MRRKVCVETLVIKGTFSNKEGRPTFYDLTADRSWKTTASGVPNYLRVGAISLICTEFTVVPATHSIQTACLGLETEVEPRDVKH
jgi:hypothetical protein